MVEPENHTLRLLREFREEFRQYRTDFGAFRGSMEDFRITTDERFNELTRLFAGESVLGRYAAADVERRLKTVEERLAALENAR